MSFAAVQKHIAVLQRAGLVTKERRGREHIVSTDPGSLRRARDAVARLEAVWRDRVDRMSDLLADDSGTTNYTVTTNDTGTTNYTVTTNDTGTTNYTVTTNDTGTTTVTVTKGRTT